MKKWLLILVLLLCGGLQRLSAQQDWSWVFGDSVLMRFPNGGAPVVDSLFRSRYSYETVNSISDSAGNLKYYLTEDSIHRADGTWPPGSTHLYANNMVNSSTILPVWGEDSSYLIFLISFDCPVTCPRLTEITIHNGQDTIPYNVSLGIYEPLHHLVEKVSAVRDAKGTGWWVLYHGERDNKFIKFKVDGGNVSPMTIQAIGSIHDAVGSNPYYTGGEMTFSPQGDKLLLVTLTGIVDVFDFDRCTGELSNWDTLSTSAPNWPGPNVFYGCSFSPDGTKVYASDFDNNWVSRLWQWDLNAPDPYASRTLIYTIPMDTVEFGQHQLGPDGKIYISNLHQWDSLDASNFNLSVINDPNQAGLACNFTYCSLNLKGRRTTYSLPNLPNFNLPPMVAQVAEAGPQPAAVCPGDSVRIGYPDSTGGAVAYRWWPAAGVADSTAAYTWAAPDTTTMYYLTALDTAMGAPCGETVDSVLVRVVASGEIPVASLGADTTVCAGDSVSLGAGGETGWQYAWSNGDTTAEIIAPAGTYSVTVTNPASNLHCYADSDTIRIDTFPAPPLLPAEIAGPSFVICRGDTVQIGNPSLPSGWVYSWSPGTNLSSQFAVMPLAYPTGNMLYGFWAMDSASGGRCLDILDTMSITVEQPFAHAAPEGVAFCVGECFMLGVPPVAGYIYRWSPTEGLSSPTASMTRAQPAGTTQYTLTVTDTAAQSASCREGVFFVTATADGCSHQSFIAVNGDGVAEVLDLGDHAGRVTVRVFDDAGRLVYGLDDYKNDWDASTLANGMYIYVVTVLGECPSTFTGKVLVVR